MASRDQDQRREVGHKPPHPGLPVREIVVAAARAARQDPWRILAVAIAVSTVTALLDSVAEEFIDRADHPLAITSDLVAYAVSLLGTVFLAGFLCRIVGAERGAASATIRELVRSLRWSRLIRADLLVVAAVLVGIVALVIPGLMALSLFAIVGPVIDIEDLAVVAAMRRSARLVWQHFWWVTLVVWIPLALAGQIESIAPGHGGAGAIAEAIIVRGLGEAVLEAAIGLILVEICYRLIEQDAARKVKQPD